MQPKIEYTRSPDGTSIACWSLGEGAPVLLLPNPPFSSIELEWRIRPNREWYEHLASRHRLIGFDGRGSGHSQRGGENFSLEAQVADISAVVARFGLERFPLIGLVHSCAPAIAYAARYPERVERMVLWGPYARGEEYASSPRIQAARALMTRDWQLYADTVGFFGFGWDMREQAESMRNFVEESSDPPTVIRMVQAMDHYDVSPLLGQVRCPTLVLQRRKAAWPTAETVSSVAAGIPGAQLASVEGESTAIWAGKLAQVNALIDAFLDEAPALGPVALAEQAPEPLTAREREVLRLLAAGSSNKEIGAALGLSVHTVERHVANIYTKIDARGRADATAYALRNGIA